MDIKERFFRKVKKTDGCWLWTGAKDSGGYGIIKHDGKVKKAHRIIYEICNGPISKGFCVCHFCDVPQCVKLEHLYLGTHQDNMSDMARKKRYKIFYGENHGMAKLTRAKIVSIHKERQLGKTYVEIAHMFNVTFGHIWKIINKKVWAHVDLSSPASSPLKS